MGTVTHPGGPAADRERRLTAAVRDLAEQARVHLPLRRDGVPLLDGALSGGPHPWFLDRHQRGNPATRMRTWTTGNAAVPLIHGRAYFERLADVLDGVGDGDLVLFAGWRSDPERLLRDDGTTVHDALRRAVRRGATVKGLIWRSQLEAFRFSAEQNRDLAEGLSDIGAEILLDHRVRPLGCHHQKFVVVRHRDRPQDDVAFVGGIDLALSRRDDAGHAGDPQRQEHFSHRYGPTPSWHDVQVELRGPVVGDVEVVFRERWEDTAALSRMPWQVLTDLVRGTDRRASPLPGQLPDPPRAGTCAVQLLRTYPNRWPGYPFAPNGERSAARGYAKALRRARRLVYVEDQYLWSTDVAAVFAAALEREPDLHVVAVVPRHPEHDAKVGGGAMQLGHGIVLEMLQEAGGDRVVIADVENHLGEPVYVHAKVCVVDDVWATVGSDNFNRRSWTHDSELTAAVLDESRDTRAPTDPAGLGDGARVFARDLRLRLWREHLDMDDEEELVDPARAVEVLRHRIATLDAWYEGGCVGQRPPGRLRGHPMAPPTPWQRVLAGPAYRVTVDPDGRPPRMKLHRRH